MHTSEKKVFNNNLSPNPGPGLEEGKIKQKQTSRCKELREQKLMHKIMKTRKQRAISLKRSIY